MALELGTIASDKCSCMSTEELLIEASGIEIEFAEILHSMENIENAKQIQELAKQYNSNEVIQFAEHLLGFSVEVQLPNINKITDDASMSSESHKIGDMIIKLASKIKEESKTLNRHIRRLGISNMSCTEATRKYYNGGPISKMFVKVLAENDGPLGRMPDTMGELQEFMELFSNDMLHKAELVEKNRKNPKAKPLKYSDDNKALIKKFSKWLSACRTMLTVVMRLNTKLTKER